jgi:hypothetical protein
LKLANICAERRRRRKKLPPPRVRHDHACCRSLRGAGAGRRRFIAVDGCSDGRHAARVLPPVPQCEAVPLRRALRRAAAAAAAKACFQHPRCRPRRSHLGHAQLHRRRAARRGAVGGSGPRRQSLSQQGPGVVDDACPQPGAADRVPSGLPPLLVRYLARARLVCSRFPRFVHPPSSFGRC